MQYQRHKVGQALETLERRDYLTAIPFGASAQDTAEYLLGDVLVNVVFLESDGSIDESSEDWTQEEIADTKARIAEGVLWWADTLETYTDVHKLNFTFDYSLADTPYETSYEPITRKSQDFRIWIEEFFRDQNIDSSAGFSTEIRSFNHQQRLEHDTNWSFTIFVVHAENDRQFAAGSDFSRAFAFTGGRFIVMPHHRPAPTVAHELAHIFWAHDEYSKSDSYFDQRGYYRTQNTNAIDDNPDPDSQESSILLSTSTSSTGAYRNHLVSQSARETLGWRDSDGDGIFDVLDVDHKLNGTITFDTTSRTARFVGSSSVQTLPNANPSGTGNDITINRITDLQYRFDTGPWQDLVEFDDYQVTIDVVTPPAPIGVSSIEFRTIDDRINVASNSISDEIESGPPQLQNPLNSLDVSGDGAVTPVDVLYVLQAINNNIVTPIIGGAPYYDVSGDGFVTPRDALAIINHINDTLAESTAGSAEAPEQPATLAESAFIAQAETKVSLPQASEPEGELVDDRAVSARDALFALFSSQRDKEESRPEFWS